MVIAYHLIFTAYGWWLPNDPRGSSSYEIRSDLIAQLGALHHGRKKVQPCGADIRAFYDRARNVLRHELREFDSIARTLISDGFAAAISARKYTCYACAIMPDHAHVLIRKHRDKSETMIEQLQEASRAVLLDKGNYPEDHPVWGGPGWKVYLNTSEDIRRTIDYIVKNPLPYGLEVQRHSFVTKYDGWDLRGAAR